MSSASSGGPDIAVTVAAERGAASRPFIRACGEYAFKLAGCERVTLETEQPAVVRASGFAGVDYSGLVQNNYFTRK